ncbi:Sucrase/ferredoxin-like-domain-containing protein [Boletus edulis BED1]|uniref:Sucrase/ferredoxin-like-domain-containing protein n=1 Tax=Boletus edulis BED1 TaxID=1328754 RepID=A0AAD4BZ72_BOLED|nr:Sucrase/ferredoxin-like-domain-containing protein [Boletus edulis BED1]
MNLFRSLPHGCTPARTSTGWATLGRSTLCQRALSTTTLVPEQLAGTAPAHRCYAFLHTPQPPSAYPAKYTTPVQRKLLLATAPWGGAVNFAWSPSQPVHPCPPNPTNAEEPQTYHLTAFSSARGKLEIEAVSLANVEDVARTLHAHIEPRTTASGGPSHCDSESAPNDLHLYVCTHGARDCRCGHTGGAVARTIRAELDKRRERDASDPSTRIKLAQVAHVGGHKYAANVLVYPHGEWLGNVKPENIPEIIDAILARPVRPMHPEEMPICPSHWRGRMGLSKEEQVELFNRFSSK